MSKYSIMDWVIMVLFDIAVISWIAQPAIISYFTNMQDHIPHPNWDYNGMSSDVLAGLMNGWAIGIGITKGSIEKKAFTFIILIICMFTFSNMDSSYINREIADPTLRSQCYISLKINHMFSITVTLIFSAYLAISNKVEDFNPLEPILNRFVLVIGIVSTSVILKFIF